MEQQSKRTVGKQAPTPKRKQMTARTAGTNEHAAGPSATKSGPGRYGKSGPPGNRISKARPVRAYKALMNAWAAKRVTKAALRDEHGAYTTVGSIYEIEGMSPSDTEHVISGGKDHGQPFFTARRKWLAGISAQRGF